MAFYHQVSNSTHHEMAWSVKMNEGLKNKQTKKVDIFHKRPLYMPHSWEAPSSCSFTSFTLMSQSLNTPESIISTHIHIKLWNKDIFYRYGKEDSGFILLPYCRRHIVEINMAGSKSLPLHIDPSITQYCIKETHTLTKQQNMSFGR